ncbi:MAG: dihydroorotate dehydrogenase electron transfer subunit, partial [Spirochaetota bacterium]
RSADELLFPGGLIDAANQYDCTDDGSAGEKGTVLDICALHLRYTDYDSIAVSGPEPMLQAVINSLDGLNVPSFFLIERYMKCAIGICGQCSLDPDGVRVCVEGPVFERSRLAALTEFGSYKRDAAGLRRPFGV